MDRKTASLRRSSSGSRKKLILCFDGTGNEFQGNGGDSNIIKIFSMLDRENDKHYAYYQPGIGTYVESSALTKTGRLAKVRSAYAKAKDSAIGTSFAYHVQDAYIFLMRYYSTGDDIYMFGFSRGAYTARFLAQMLDCVGLLNVGNEEMFRFAWKAFSRWQRRHDRTEKEKKEKQDMFEFMVKFRDTFTRPIRRVRFLGLFDTVNSVPWFETALLKRTKFPYTANSSAKVIRHAVSIDERRAKFRQDLISEKRPDEHPHLHHLQDSLINAGEKNVAGDGDTKPEAQKAQDAATRHHLHHRFRPKRPKMSSKTVRKSSRDSFHSTSSRSDDDYYDDSDAEDEVDDQDIQEIWFPGCHADIGGGWPLGEGEDASLSHAPLLWMIREARAAGLPFNERALRDSNYILNETTSDPAAVPALTDPTTSNSFPKPSSTSASALPLDQAAPSSGSKGQDTALHRMLHAACTRGKMHDSLVFGQGTGALGVAAWNAMEYLPFRRVDLQDDGSWRAIRWPLPMGEIRDMPGNAVVHNTALRRMRADEGYRPGNLVVGGGGRGVKRALGEVDFERWRVVREEGDPIGEVFVRMEGA